MDFTHSGSEPECLKGIRPNDFPYKAKANLTLCIHALVRIAFGHLGLIPEVLKSTFLRYKKIIPNTSDSVRDNLLRFLVNLNSATIGNLNVYI